MPLTPLKILQEQPGQFVTALAHEIRNPLSSINMAVEILKSMNDNDEQKKYLEIINRGYLRINDLVTDLISWEEKEIKPEKHSVHELLDEVLEITEDRMILKNITVRKDYTTIDCSVMVNRRKMRIALINIIINSVDAMPSENGKLKLITRSINGKCVIEIGDNGIGISQENLKNIFKPYYTNKPGGMGLGLSTTLQILLENNARVDVQSEEGKGTRFIISFDRDSTVREMFE
jgi:signal transduction histidine kinase